MLPKVSSIDAQFITAEAEIADIQEVTTIFRDKAIEYAVSRSSVPGRKEDLQTLSQKQEFLSHLKCGLAKGVGDFLSQNDVQVKEVYLFEPEANPDVESGVLPTLDATVHLLVLIGTPSAALEALISALDRALTQSLKDSTIPVYAKYRSVLDVIPITAEDVKQRRGFASLLTSIFTPPLRVC